MRHDQPTAAAIARVTAVLALALLLLGLLSPVAGAQLPGARPKTTTPDVQGSPAHPPQPPEPPIPPSPDMEDDDAPWMVDGHGLGPCMEQLDLTDQQKSRIEDLRAEARRDMIRARGDVAKASAELQAQASDPTATRSSIERLAAEVQRDRNALHDRMLKTHLDQREVLTQQQREMLAKCRWGGRMHGREAHMRGRGWRGTWQNGWGRAWF